MAPIAAIGQAAGVAAGLTVKLDAVDVRDVDTSRIRQVLKESGQFVEGPCDEALEPVQPQG